MNNGPSDTDFLPLSESKSYQELVTRDLAVLDTYHASNPDKQREIENARQTLKPLLALETLTYGDCKIIDTVFDEMQRLGLPLSEER